MRRADRLFLLVQALRGRRAVTARRLADGLRVSTRTVYRDVQDLQLAGVPIEGEAGVGYVLRRGSDIPPLMFTRDELEALVIGARFVDAFASATLADSARHALTKIEAVLPEELKRRQERSRVLAPATPRFARDRALMGEVHAAIAAHHVVHLEYAREDGSASAREVEPLCLAFWGHAWTLGAWCRLRRDFRNFRIDRIATLEPREEVFAETEQRGLNAYLRVACGGRDGELFEI
jgi:predicted DNA-binding transcriptional regulator YafY